MTATSTPRVRAIGPETSQLVGRNLMRLRKERDILRPQLVQMMHEARYGMSEAVLRNMEQGHRWITVDELMAFSVVLGQPIRVFFEED